MSKLFFTTLLIVLSNLIASAQTETDTVIYWSAGYKLKVSDFQALPDTVSSNAAETCSGIWLKYQSAFDTSMPFIVQSVFFKKKSWFKPTRDSTYILAHEQGHFDITEIYKAKMEKRIGEYYRDRDMYDEQNLIKKVNMAYSDIILDYNELESLYDFETRHSIDSAMQNKWDIYFRNVLNSR